MKSFYHIENEQLKQTSDKNAHIIVYTNIEEQEKLALIEKYELDQSDIDSIFDPDEVPRMEYENGRLFIIWKVPDNASMKDIIQFEVSSIGLIYTKGEVALIIPKGNLSLGGKEFRKMTTIFDFLLKVMLSTIRHYQSHLKAIKLIANEIETKLVVSMENKYLLQMFTIGESLIYYHNALEGNSTILVNLRYIAEKLKL
ncbi:MAG TPA: CorA family divalent cation transporter, partial [Victivallales bacterium]|nr:CorA family divalent cation transporter [Victivallales bacterium]